MQGDDTALIRRLVGIALTNDPNAIFPVESRNALLARLVALFMGAAESGVAPAIVTVPAAPDSPGSAGQIAYDDDHLYVYTPSGEWKRINLNSWTP